MIKFLNVEDEYTCICRDFEQLCCCTRRGIDSCNLMVVSEPNGTGSRPRWPNRAVLGVSAVKYLGGT